MAHKTIAAILEECHYRTSGFDYLRISLALGVIFWHGSVVVYGHEYDAALGASWVGTVFKFILPMFFALSGFLVAGSLLRTNSLMEYASFRVLRIFPALTVEVLLSAFVLGALVTALPLSQYYTEGEFLRYLGNIAGIIYVYLPGVFTENPSRWVNISLWTVPYELECYLILLAIAAFGIVKRPMLFAVCLVVLQILLPIYDFQALDEFSRVTRIFPRTLILCFLAGVGIYIFRERIPNSFALAAACMVACYWMIEHGAAAYFISVPIAYATVVIGITNPPKAPVIFSGDYSYGMYLYAFPFQQLHMYLFPTNDSWFANMAFAIPVTAVFAVFSWTFIEKPILQKRRYLTAKVTGLVQRRPRAG